MISLTEAESEPTTTIAVNDAKPSIGKTGVHLCYHKHHEYKKLMCEQCHELSEWQQNNPDTHKPSYVKKPCGPDRFTQSKQISTLISKQVAAEIQKLNKSAHIDTALVGASPDNANQEEKDLQDQGLGNNAMVTPAPVQLGPGGENAKELPDKADFMGESKECAVSSRRPKTDVASKGYTRHQA